MKRCLLYGISLDEFDSFGLDVEEAVEVASLSQLRDQSGLLCEFVLWSAPCALEAAAVDNLPFLLASMDEIAQLAISDDRSCEAALLEAGFDDVLVRPCQPRVIASRVSRALAGKRQSAVEQQLTGAFLGLRALSCSIVLVDLEQDACFEYPGPYGDDPFRTAFRHYSNNYQQVLSAMVVPADAPRVIAEMSLANLRSNLTPGNSLYDRFQVKVGSGPLRMYSIEATKTTADPNRVVLLLRDVSKDHEREETERAQAVEQGLVRNQELLSQILEFSGVDFCEYDPVTDDCVFSRRSADRHGLRSPTVPNFSKAVLVSEALHPDDRRKYGEMMASVRDGASYAECEVRMLDAATGKWMWMNNCCRAMYRGSKPLKIIGTAVSIDDYKRIESLYVQACAQNDISVWDVDVPTRTVRPNNRFGEVNQFGTGFEGVANVDVVQVERGQIHPDDVGAYTAMLNQVWSGQHEVGGQVRHWSTRYRRYSWFKYFFTLVEISDGKPQTYLATVRDISAEKEAEERFAEELDNRSLADPSLMAYCRLNLTKRQVEDAKNRIRECQFDPMDMPVNFGDRLAMCVEGMSVGAAQLRNMDADALDDAFARGITEVLNSFWVTLPDGTETWVHVNCRMAERRETGEVVAFFYVYDRTATHLRGCMLDNLAQHSFERSAAIFTNSNRLVPIVELSAPFDGMAKTYGESLASYCNTKMTPETAPDAARQMTIANIMANLEKADHFAVQYDVVGDDGQPRRKQTEYSYIDRNQGVILAMRTDVAAYEGLRYLSEHDPLTGLANRGSFLAQARRILDDHPNQKFMMVQADIDHFNVYNSSFGEDEGDRLLRFAANTLSRACAKSAPCVIARINADLFYILAPFGQENLLAANDYLLPLFDTYRADYTLTFSVGAYAIEDPGMNLEDVVSKAAKALRKAKGSLDQNVAFYDAVEERQAEVEEAIRRDMDLALENEEFQVYLQPKYLVAGDVPCGAEALVRWQHPEKGMVSPGVFIPVFERNGFIAKLDGYMWEKTCQLLSTWVRAGLEPAPVSVNISRISLYNPNLVQVLVDLVRKHDIPARLLQLEITESAYMTNPELMQEVINGLHDAGFTILMDDFGSGYSSLNTLKDFPIDVLKVDMKFLPKDGNVEAGEIIIASIIRMAQWLGMQVVMEGVETREERDFLEGVGCDVIQGYFYARPMPAADYQRGYVESTPEPLHLSHAERRQQVERKRILLIDDDLIPRKMMAHLLEGSYEVVGCGSAEEALTLLKRADNDMDLIIVDNFMPGMTGLDFLEYCHDDERLNAIPKFMMTADTDVQTHVKALKLGATGFFNKPIDPDVVMTYVTRTLDVVPR